MGDNGQLSTGVEKNRQSLKMGLVGEGFLKEVQFKLDSGRTKQRQARWRTGISKGMVSSMNMKLDYSRIPLLSSWPKPPLSLAYIIIIIS